MSKTFSITLRKDLSKVIVEMPDDANIDQWVIFESEGINDIGKIESTNLNAESSATFVKYANLKDLSQIKKLETEEDSLSQLFTERSKENGLKMELIECVLSFDEKKVTFYFSADGRIDFRDLLRDLVKLMGKLIRLQQVGPRDNIKLLKGSYGICGQKLCCQRFLKSPGKVSMESVQIQCAKGISKTKITGCCGKLMCCLSYEDETYKEMLKKYPKIGAKVKTKSGIGVVDSISPMSGKITVNLDDGGRVDIIKKMD